MNANSNLNRTLALGGQGANSLPIAQKPDVCSVCGAPVRKSTKYGWGTYAVYECGKISDDGPGTPCPKTPKWEPVVEVAPAAPEPTKPAEVAETFPVVLVEGLLQEVKIIPELSKADRLEAVLVHLEGFANMVVTKDDKKGADLAEKNRLLTKRIRVAASKICKDEREDAVEELKKIQSFWIATDRSIETRLKAVEEHLAAQVKVYTDEKDRIAKEAEAEKARLAAESAAEAKRVLQARIQRLMDLGAVPNVVQIATATDAEFEAIVAAAAEAQSNRIAQQETERQEREHLAAQQRARAELIQSRISEVYRGGLTPWWASLEALADLTADEFADALVERIEAKALADEDAERIRMEREAADAVSATNAAELERLRKESADRAAEDRQLAKIEEYRQAAEAQRIADEARAVAEAARIEAERPDREKAFTWLDSLEFDVAIPFAGIESEAIRTRLSELTTPILLAIQAAKREFQP